MKAGGMVVLLMLLVSVAMAGGIQVQRMQGDVSVRQGVTEVWTRVAVGDVLRPDDTMKTGLKGSAVLMVSMGNGTFKRISLPPEVIVDMSDIRELSQDELMLKLTMEKVRSSPYEWKNEDLQVPNAAVIHGTDKSTGSAALENDPAVGLMQLNGTRVLYENGYYSTCALKAMEVFRFHPSLAGRFENRLLVAEALERARLRGEAINEYGAMLKMQSLTVQQRDLVQARMEDLKR
jgi:hypothetical protein